MTAPAGKENKPRTPRYKVEGVVLLLLGALALALTYGQFRGDFTSTTRLTMLAARAGLVMDPGSKVTYNGVEIGRVAGISEIERDGRPAAKFILEVLPRYLKLIPANVDAKIQATTVFGGKYVSFTSPRHPSSQRITPQQVIDTRSVTTEVNTLLQTITEITEKVDPVKVNLTLSAAADALNGLGDKFGAAIVNGNNILDDINPRMPLIRHDIQRLADLGNVYADASPDLWNSLNHAVTTAHTLRNHQDELDSALLAAVGFGDTAGEVIERGGPYLARGTSDLTPTAHLLNTYSPELFCTIRNFDDVRRTADGPVGGANGYSFQGIVEILGAENPYVYPDNLPRLNAKGGPGGRPGCWQPITRDLWPAPFLVADTGASIAPYNHFEIGSPYATEYVWGRQVGDNTINP